MNPRTFLLVVSLQVGFCAPATSMSPSNTVKQVEMTLCWAGLGDGQRTELVIHGGGGTYRPSDDRVDPASIENLVAALRQPAVLKPDAGDLGIDQAWLDANAIPAALKNSGDFLEAAPNQQALYRRAFTDLNIIQKVVPSLYDYIKFDDYPSARIVVTFQDGSSVCATTRSYYLLMLPWEVVSGDHTDRTYNADLSRAVAALLPKQATNRSRLAGDDVATELGEAVMRHIEDDWNFLDVENRASPAIGRLRNKYTVVTAEINPYHQVEYGKEWKRHRRHESNLHATVRTPDFPANFSDALVLLFRDGRVEGMDDFMRSGVKYESLALSVPWLNTYMREQPRVPVRLSYVHDASIGEKALEVFSADMRTIGKRDLVSEVKVNRSEIVLLITGIKYAESYWLVFPDKHMLLWRYGGPSGLLKWTSADLVTHECSDYQGVTGGCVGALVSPEGALVDEGHLLGRHRDRS